MVRLLRGLKNWRLSLFEKVILVNSIMLAGEALAGLWVTSHNLEAHHYVIDTLFIVLAMLLMLLTNVFLLRASFRPLFNLLATMRAVSGGKTQARAEVDASSDAEIGELAKTFNSMLDRLEEARREQTHMILQAQEEERRRIALELHDEAGQNLTALLIHAEVLSQSFQEYASSVANGERQQQFAEELRQLIALAQHTLENVRVLAQQLRPSVLDDLGLLAAFRWLVEDSRQRLCLAVSLTIDEQEIWRQLPPAYETALFRIAQESLTNIARHARASQASIALQCQQQKISLIIRDDGCGYDTAMTHAGMGTIGMRERARMLGGTLRITSLPGKGTIVRATLPLPSAPKRTLSGQENGVPVLLAEKVATHGL